MSTSLLSVSEALNLILSKKITPETEYVSLTESLGKVLAEPVVVDRQ